MMHTVTRNTHTRRLHTHHKAKQEGGRGIGGCTTMATARRAMRNARNDGRRRACSRTHTITRRRTTMLAQQPASITEASKVTGTTSGRGKAAMEWAMVTRSGSKGTTWRRTHERAGSVGVEDEDVVACTRVCNKFPACMNPIP